MNSLTLSTDNIISLTKLAAAVRKEYGQRFVLSEENSLWNLLKLAAESGNQVIKLAFSQFYEGLDSEQQQNLVYRGVKIGESAAELDIPPVGAKTTKTIVYRGQVIEEPVVAEEAEPAQPKKSRRIYRGRVIEE